jgi:uncharacterized protein (TIGR02466 family)
MQNNTLNIYTLFPTPVIEKQIQNFYEIKDSLVEDIYEYESEVPKGTSYSNYGGWHSPTEPQLFHTKRFEKYFDFIYQEIKYCLSKILDKSIDITYDNIINSWANINRKGNYNFCHYHPKGTLSVVLFVSCPYRFSGNLVLRNSHTDLGHHEIYNQKIKQDLNLKRSHKIEPFDGKLVIFPSSSFHYVESNETDMDRISIAMDIDL